MQSRPPSYRESGDKDEKDNPNFAAQPAVHANQNQAPPSWPIQNQVYPFGPGGPQILYVCTPPPTNVYENYKGTQSIWNGLLQILLGFLCIGFNAGSIDASRTQHFTLFSVIGYGIWGGVLFLVTGSFGIAAGKLKTKCMIIAFMVLCILSCAVDAIIFSFSVINVVYASSERYHLQIALNGVLLVLSVIYAAVGIWASVNCCSVACCGAPKMYLSNTPNHQFNQPNTQVIVVDNLQQLNPAMLQQGPNLQQLNPAMLQQGEVTAAVY